MKITVVEIVLSLRSAKHFSKSHLRFSAFIVVVIIFSEEALLLFEGFFFISLEALLFLRP